MRILRAILLAAPALALAWGADAPKEETLRYSINWPSGLSLGEAQLESAPSASGWKLAFVLDAAIPGFTARDRYESQAAGDYCSAEFTKRCTHGKRRIAEKTVFEGASGTALRQTLEGGGSSRLTVPACPHDALAFLYYLRRELANGRLPGPQTVYFGAPYQVRLEFGGLRPVRVNDEPVETERVVASFKGPASNSSVEMYFARDAVRTPVLVRLALQAGTFTMELVR
ncbi:MAG TPA: DUF3108 domain-containing protein [Bryobacteraceae bacterium]|nr:DUF3108 domain-containing protein [Bryobacteraceae bacterium]